MADTSRLTSGLLVITEKMDGENTTIHAEGCHPRSLDARYHPSRDWMKAFAAGIAPQLEVGERIVGEYLYARHSLAYSNLPSYFLGFAWIRNGYIEDWDATLQRFEGLGIMPVPMLYRGAFTRSLLGDVIDGLDLEQQEGFVIRTSTGFEEVAMPTHLAKYVRAGHVTSEKHWMNAEVIRNGLA